MAVDFSTRGWKLNSIGLICTLLHLRLLASLAVAFGAVVVRALQIDQGRHWTREEEKLTKPVART
jgi:hypothetical protein